MHLLLASCYYFHTSFENSNLSGPQTCEFFFFTAPEEQNSYSTNFQCGVLQRWERVLVSETSDAVIKILWFHM